MAGVLEKPVTVAWAGLGAMTAAILFLLAVRSPVFPEIERRRPMEQREAALGVGVETGSKAGADAPSAKPPSAKEGWSLPIPVPGGGTDTPTPAVTPGPDQRAAVQEFLDRVRRNDLKGSVTALEALAKDYPDALKDKEVRGEIVELSQRVMQVRGDEPQRMFDVLATKTGSDGIDILYYLVTSKGGSKASKAADAMLADPKIVARGSEAMRVAWELRKAPCAKKRELFARAGKYGDQRTIGQLFELNRSCGRRNRNCCMHKDPELEAAIEAMKARGYGG